MHSHPRNVCTDFSPALGTEWDNNSVTHNRIGICMFSAFGSHIVIPASKTSKKVEEIPYPHLVPVQLKHPSVVMVSEMKPLQGEKFRSSFSQPTVQECQSILSKWKDYFTFTKKDEPLITGQFKGGRGTVWRIKNVPQQLQHLTATSTLDVIVLSPDQASQKARGNLVVPLIGGFGYYDRVMFISEERFLDAEHLGTISIEDQKLILSIIYEVMGGSVGGFM